MAQSRKVTTDEAGMRLDRWFRQHFPALSQGGLQKLLRTGQVRIDGARAKTSDRLDGGQMVRIPPQLGPEPTHVPSAPVVDLKARAEDAARLTDMILFEDRDLLVLNKPPGLAVQGGSKTKRHIDGMLASLERHGDRPRLVHRLDRDTSGVLVCARTRAIAAKLGKALAGRQVDKIYWAIVSGVPKPEQGTIDLPLFKSPLRGQDKVRPARASDEGAQKALTDYAIADHATNTAAMAVLKPVTGRQHQLRVHMAEIGCPILGDLKYGAPEAMPGVLERRLHLHARQIRFRHPRDARMVDIVAPPPSHIQEAMNFFGFSAHSAEEATAALFER